LKFSKEKNNIKNKKLISGDFFCNGLARLVKLPAAAILAPCEFCLKNLGFFFAF